MLEDLLGIGASDLTIVQMCLRAAVVYGVALLMVRVVGDRRFAGKYAAIDIVLSITLGATLSRAIGSKSFFPTIAAGLVLVTMHWLTATIALRFPITESWLKGSPRVLIRKGEVQQDAFATSNLTRRDLEMAIRGVGQHMKVEDIALAVLETNGDITILNNLSPEEISEILETEDSRSESQ